MQDQIERDLKAALLSGDKAKAETLRTLKSAILNKAIDQNLPRDNLSDQLIEFCLRREAKKRQEAAELYQKVGEAERAQKELTELAVIEAYLPEQMGETEVKKLVIEEISKIEKPESRDMGRIIGAIRSKTEGRADGSLIAKLVKESLENQ